MADVNIIGRLYNWGHRLGIASVLVVFGVSKLIYAANAHEQVLVIGKPLLLVAAMLELGVGLALLLWSSRAALWLGLGLALSLLGATGLLIASGIAIEQCGCFGAKALTARQHVGIALGLLSISLSALVGNADRDATTSRGSRAPGRGSSTG